MAVIAALLFPGVGLIDLPNGGSSAEVLSGLTVTTPVIAPASYGRTSWTSDRLTAQRALLALTVRSSLFIRQPSAIHNVQTAPGNRSKTGEVRILCGRSPPDYTSHA